METLEIDKGYWRATNTSTLVLPCYNTEACVGGITGSPGYCDDGYDGPCEWLVCLYQVVAINRDVCGVTALSTSDFV